MSQHDQKRRKVAPGFLKRFGREEDGILTIEAIMVFPLLIWSIWATYTYFDGYRQSARNLKASYAVADVISREKTTIDETYIDTLYGVLQHMVSDRSEMSMRMTFVTYDLPSDTHDVCWSFVRGDAFEEWTNGTISAIKGKLPVMPDYGKMIIVETENLYRRPYKLGFGRNEFPMSNFVFTHPRVFDNVTAYEDDCLGG